MSTEALDQAFRRTRTGWWMVAVFCFAGLVSYTDRLILSVLVDPIRKELLIGDSQVSLLQGAAFALIYVLAGLPLGRLADRGKRLNILIGGAVLWCLGVVACGFAPNFLTLFVGRLLVGAGEAALAPCAISMIADAFPPRQRGAALGVFLMGMVLGGPMAITVGGALLGWAQAGAFAALPVLGGIAPWRAVLVVTGLAGLLAPLLFLTLSEPSRKESAGAVSLTDVISRFLGARRILVPLYGGMALLSVGSYGLLSWMPSLLARKFAMQPAQLGMVFGAITAVAGVAGALAGGFVSDRAERRGGPRARFVPVALGAVLGAFAAALVSGGLGLYMALLGLGLWTLASEISHIGAIAALQDLVPNEYRGVAISLIAFCNTLLGLGVGPTLVALATERVYANPTSVGQAITLVILPAAAGACVLFIICRRVLHGGRAIEAAEV
jgi:MFS family permease